MKYVVSVGGGVLIMACLQIAGHLLGGTTGQLAGLFLGLPLCVFWGFMVGMAAS